MECNDERAVARKRKHDYVARVRCVRQAGATELVNRRVLPLVSILICTPGCIVVGGYSSTDGWFVWPGGLVISVLVILLFVFLARGRRRF